MRFILLQFRKSAIFKETMSKKLQNQYLRSWTSLKHQDTVNSHGMLENTTVLEVSGQFMNEFIFLSSCAILKKTKPTSLKGQKKSFNIEVWLTVLSYSTQGAVETKQICNFRSRRRGRGVGRRKMSLIKWRCVLYTNVLRTRPLTVFKQFNCRNSHMRLLSRIVSLLSFHNGYFKQLKVSNFLKQRYPLCLARKF